MAPDRPGRCDRRRRHPRRRAGSASVSPHPGGPRPTLPASGYSAGRSRKATDRCLRVDATRDHTRNTDGRAVFWRGLRSPASGRWRWAQPSASRNARNRHTPSALDSARSRPAPLLVAALYPVHARQGNLQPLLVHRAGNSSRGFPPTGYRWAKLTSPVARGSWLSAGPFSSSGHGATPILGSHALLLVPERLVDPLRDAVGHQ